jgi:hypothetical protein
MKSELTLVVMLIALSMCTLPTLNGENLPKEDFVTDGLQDLELRMTVDKAITAKT